MIDYRRPICLALKSGDEVAFFSGAFKTLGFTDIHAFADAETVLSAISKSTFDFFVLRMEMPKISGIVLLQKIIASGGSGHETVLFIADKMSLAITNVLLEYDINYILTKPFNFQRIEQKFQYILEHENTLSPVEKLLRQARKDFHAGRLDEASALLDKLREHPDTAVRAKLLSGDVALQRGRPGVARDFYGQVTPDAHHAPIAAQKIADSYVREGNFLKAAEICAAITPDNPYNLKLLENAGLSYFEVGDKPKSQQTLAAIRLLDRRNKASSEVESRIFIQEGNFEKIIDTLAASHTDEDLVYFLNNEGVKMSRNGNYGGAINMYSQCLNKMGTNTYRYILYYNMAASYKKMGDKQQALKLLTMALEVNPSYERALDALKQLDSIGSDVELNNSDPEK